MEELSKVYPGLQPFILTNVNFTGRSIGAGAYGSVEEVEIAGAVCAAKHIHKFFKETPQDSQGRATEQFVKECQLISRLRHPNIVQFLGVCMVPESRLPALVMERLETSLHDLLELPPPINRPKSYFPLCMKCSILYDVASGLAYLHEQSPPVIHRDLSARNILLNSGMVAKIADLGVARILPRCQLNVATTMTKAPGASVYMPPEAVEQKSDRSEDREKSKYDSSIDVFAFGVVSLFTLTQTFPCDLLGPTYRDKETGKLLGREEIERREKYMGILYNTLPRGHELVEMIIRCLDIPEKRPRIREVLELIQHTRGESKDEMINMNKLELMQALHSKQSSTKAPEEEVDADQKQTTEMGTDLERWASEKEKLRVVTGGEDITKERLLTQETEKKIRRLESLESDLKKKVFEQQDSISTLRKENEELQVEIYTTNVVLQRMTTVEEENEKWKMSCIKQAAVITTLRGEKNDLALLAKTNEERAQVMEKEIESLREINTELNKTTKNLENDLIAAQTMAKSHEGDFRMERQDRERAMGKLSTLQREAAVSEATIKNLQTQLTMVTSKRDELEEELRQITAEQTGPHPPAVTDISCHHSQQQFLGVPDETRKRCTGVIRPDSSHTYVNIKPRQVKPLHRYSMGDVPIHYNFQPLEPIPQSPGRETPGGGGGGGDSSNHPQIVISKEDEHLQMTEDWNSR